MTIDISVIVPFLNEERFIRRCLESLLACDYPEDRVELIFVDNGSADGGPGIVREYHRAILVTEPRGKVYTARNAGLERATGKVIAFTDADCAVAPRWLRSVHEAILDGGATVAMGAVGFATPRSSFLDVHEVFRNDYCEYAIENGYWNLVYGYTNNMAVRADVFERTGPFLELPVPGDTEIVHRCLHEDRSTPIVFSRTMWVDHLELENVRILFRKTFDYGWFEIHLPQKRCEAPGSPGLSGAVDYSIGRNRFTFRQRLLLRLGVFVSDTLFKAGIWWGRLRKRFGQVS